MNQLNPNLLLPPGQLRPVAPQPVAQPSQIQKFSQISRLLQGDQVQLSSQPGRLMSPVSLFQSRPPAVPTPSTPTPSAPAFNLHQLRQQQAIQKLKTMSPSALKELGATDRKAFFQALLPAALESEKQFGVPAAVTLAQAALESGWARSPIGGFNIFGIKGRGPAGTVNVKTQEFSKGRYVTINDNFAKYNNFYEAVKEHGELFHNGYYDKAVNQYAKNKNVYGFIDNIHGIYATDPNYSKKIKSIIEDFGLLQMVKTANMV